jgi:N-acetylglucosamine kinase
MILAVDGGGTKTFSAIIDENNLRVVGIGVAGPSNVRSVSKSTSKGNIIRSINRAKRMARCNDIKKSIYGIAGYGDSAYHTDEVNSIVKSINKDAVITNDGEAAVNLVTLGSDGIVAAVGTGSVGSYINNGRMHRIGGWSYLTDDAASGFWIARRALEMCEKSYDGLIEKTGLIKKFEDYFKMPLREVVANLEKHFDKRLMASLAIIVDESSSQNDEVSMHILKSAFGEIKLMLDGMRKNFHRDVTMGVLGGVMQSKLIRTYLKEEFNDIKIFYGYHAAIGNAIKLLNIREESIRDELIRDVDNMLVHLSQVEKDLLFIK